MATNPTAAEHAATRAAEAAELAAEEIRLRRSFPDARRLLREAAKQLEFADMNLTED
jgi:hypothetical protein